MTALRLRLPDLREQFGDIDIYLFDQLLRGRIAEGMTILDAGCGDGRNLVFLMRAGLDLYGVDERAEAITAVREQARVLAPHLPSERFTVQAVHDVSFGDATMDVVISSAVLHFSPSEDRFAASVREMWRVLAPGGVLFCRLASTIGIAEQVRPLGERQFLLPDGSRRFLVDEALLMEQTRALGGTLLDPLKTTVVQNLRAMTTWVVGKR